MGTPISDEEPSRNKIATLINHRGAIVDKLAREQPLTPDQRRSVAYLLEQIEPGLDPANDDLSDQQIAVFSYRLERFTDLLRATNKNPSGRIERAQEDIEFLLQLANERMNDLPSDIKNLKSLTLLQGARAKLRLLQEKQGCLNGSELAELLGVDRNTPRKRFEKGSLLAVRTGGKLQYPLWQFREFSDSGGEFKVLPGIAEVRKIAGSAGANDWDVFSFFLTVNVHLQEESASQFQIPIDALQADQAAVVIDVAHMTFDLE